MEFGPLAMIEIAPSVYQVSARGAQVWLLVDDGVTLVDTGLPGSAPRIEQALGQLGLGKRDVKRVVLTHYHIDHAGDLASWSGSNPITVIAHDAEVPYWSGEMPIPNPMVPPALALAARPFTRWMTPRSATIDLAVVDGDELPLMGGIQFIHTPGHTRGHLGIYIKAHQLLLSGDSLQVKAGELTTPSRVYSEDMPQAHDTIHRLAGMDIQGIALSHYRPMIGHAYRHLHGLSRRLAA